MFEFLMESLNENDNVYIENQLAVLDEYKDIYETASDLISDEEYLMIEEAMGNITNNVTEQSSNFFKRTRIKVQNKFSKDSRQYANIVNAIKAAITKNPEIANKKVFIFDYNHADKVYRNLIKTIMSTNLIDSDGNLDLDKCDQLEWKCQNMLHDVEDPLGDFLMFFSGSMDTLKRPPQTNVISIKLKDLPMYFKNCNVMLSNQINNAEKIVVNLIKKCGKLDGPKSGEINKKINEIEIVISVITQDMSNILIAMSDVLKKV